MTTLAATNFTPVASASPMPASRHGAAIARSRTAILAVAAWLIGLGLGLAPAQAQIARTFVSAATGNDGNDCNRLTPCRSFQAAHDKTLPAGEITVLDPGGYGAVTITKAISIINDGVGEAGALVSGGAIGVTVAAGASDAVSLRGLTVKGLGPAFGGGLGIIFRSGKSLTIENCVVRNVTNGIQTFPSSSGTVAISDTLVADSADAFSIGSSTGNTLHAVLSRVEAYGNSGRGLVVTDGVSLTMADSVLGNNEVGISVLGLSRAASVTVARSVIANSRTGLFAFDPFATLRFGLSAVTGNATTWSTANGGVVRSYGDNNIVGNADGNPAPTTIPRT